jgi:site-specific DNA recombinase
LARYSRTSLDRLRDPALRGDFDVVAVLSPDRLTRKYPYQTLLPEELLSPARSMRRWSMIDRGILTARPSAIVSSTIVEPISKAGCEVVFLHRPITDHPQDQLLQWIRGAVAEERAIPGKRFRRG